MGKWTFSLSVGGFIGLGGGYSFYVGISRDSEGMIALQYTYSVPNDEKTRNTVIGATASVGLSLQFTNLDSVSELEGASKSTGVNVGMVSFDAILSAPENEFMGISIGAGPGFSADFHVNEVYTTTIGSAFPSLFKILKDWLRL